MPKNIISFDTNFKIIHDSDSLFDADLGVKYGLPKATVASIMRQEEEILEKSEKGSFSSNVKRKLIIIKHHKLSFLIWFLCKFG